MKNSQKRKSAKKNMTAYEYALFLLSYCARGENQIKNRLLLKKYTSEEIAQACTKLKKYGFVDDVKTANMFIEQRLSAGKSIRFIRNELLQKEFSIDIINDQIKNAEQEYPSEFDRALCVAQKKDEKLSGISEIKKTRRIMSLLQRRGYSYETTRDVLNTLRKKIMSLKGE